VIANGNPRPIAVGTGARKVDQLVSKVGSRNSLCAIRLQVTPTARGRKWRASLDGATLCVSASPLVASARILVAQGLDPKRVIEMSHAHADTWSLRGQLGAVAATLVDGETAKRAAKNRVPSDFSGIAGVTLAEAVQ
jgi:hypothetical protein